MATTIFKSLGEIILPKGRGVKEGRAYSSTFDPRNQILTAPLYRDHLQDVYTTRTATDSRALIAQFANFDPDVSAAINAFLAVAGATDPVIHAYDENDEPDAEGVALGQQIIAALTTTNDYSLGFSNKPTLDALVTDIRYFMLLRGGAAGELILNKAFIPYELRLVDPADLEWHEAKNGKLTPLQKPAGTNIEIDLNIPTFFTTNFHQSPLDAYTYSPFVAAINTIASRQLVVNELYRIMKIVGYPRVDVSVIEKVLQDASPPAWRNDPKQMRTFIEGELTKIRNTISNLGSADAFVHSDAVEAKVINEKNPSAGLQIQGVIDVLNAQNQAALKVMPAVVGKANNGQVASTEARLFALSADALNRSVAGLLTKAVTLAARLSGYAGRIECVFPPVELRPDLELEAQRTMRASRLKDDLSRGVISDMEYTMHMYSRPPLKGAPKLSGTNFLSPVIEPDATKVTPNTDSLGRSQTAEGGNGVGQDNNASKGGGGNPNG